MSRISPRWRYKTNLSNCRPDFSLQIPNTGTIQPPFSCWSLFVCLSCCMQLKFYHLLKQMLLDWTMRSTEFLAVPVLLISLISGKLFTFQVLPVTWHVDTGTFRDVTLHVFHGPLWCWIVLAASVSISFFSVTVITGIVVISLQSYFLGYIFFLCALLYVCCMLHYGANKVSYIVFSVLLSMLLVTIIKKLNRRLYFQEILLQPLQPTLIDR